MLSRASEVMYFFLRIKTDLKKYTEYFGQLKLALLLSFMGDVFTSPLLDMHRQPGTKVGSRVQNQVFD